VDGAIARALATFKGGSKNMELAFFGGSFTAVDRDYMVSLLMPAQPYLKRGALSGIRISTRPDCIDEQILSLLKSYGVTSIELGAQSMCDTVLKENNRGHTAKNVEDASRRIRQHGFSLGLQMMTGLYKSTPQLDFETAERIAALIPDTVRIYPTVTMKGTALETLYRCGRYVPPTLEDTVALCSSLLIYFEEHGIPVIRLGLHDSEGLKEERIAGPYHPALRELCESRILLLDITKQIKEKRLPRGALALRVNPRAASKACGQRKSNLNELLKLGYQAEIVQDESVPAGSVIAEEGNGNQGNKTRGF
jgi:histone acetyltransferase (RNA polymerase elongator complex component)